MSDGARIAGAAASLIDVLNAETAAMLGHASAIPHAAAKEAIVGEIERSGDDAPADAETRDVLRRLREAATRNRTALEARRDAATGLLEDLASRLAAIDSDGTYRRGDLAPIEPVDALAAPETGT